MYMSMHVCMCMRVYKGVCVCMRVCVYVCEFVSESMYEL